ncbi:hypothetical protein [uncultured Maribacter sp.]|uniref:hypothetical protein n=1 Tax=uncultured Maribacter sp. TaxID=431308 RepID=UPI002632A97A|nr:hypothetical protein [uncultured Maribacter sp.]
MRKISLVLVAAMLLSAGSILANDFNGVNPTKTLKTQISKLLTANVLTESEVNATAQVRFTINKNREIVVLSVDTNNSNIESFVKGRLNYKKVALAQYVEGRLYIVPVRIES